MHRFFTCSCDHQIQSVAIFVGRIMYMLCQIEGSLLSLKAFLKRVLTILTADSPLPFDIWYVGEEVTCLNSQSAANCINSRLTICDPLSVTRQSRIPFQLICFLRNCVTTVVLELCYFDEVGYVIH